MPCPRRADTIDQPSDDRSRGIVEGIHRGQVGGVTIEAMGLLMRRFLGQAEADLVWHNHPMAGGDQCRDHLAPQIAPGGVAVEEEDGITLALIHIVDSPRVYGRVARAVRPGLAGFGWWP